MIDGPGDVAVAPETIKGEPASDLLMRVGTQCDRMCYEAGERLGQAIPTLSRLTESFGDIVSSLTGEQALASVRELQDVTRTMAHLGEVFVKERDLLARLVSENRALTAGTERVAEHVEYLSALVTNVKIEVGSIREDEDRLDSFATNLAHLIDKARVTIQNFQKIHEGLLKKLHLAVHAQSAFVQMNAGKFETAAGQIGASLETVSARRAEVAHTAELIMSLTRGIGGSIGRCVVALQVGDNTRQRLEHTASGFLLAQELARGEDKHQLFVGDDAGEAQMRAVAARVYALQGEQIRLSATEFSDELNRIKTSIARIRSDQADLIARSELLASARDCAGSFLDELRSNLAAAGTLMAECATSRESTDRTVREVLDTATELQAVASNIATLARDMTIIGTNAVVTSYRLGTKGLPLGVISQHLRDYAVEVVEALRIVPPALSTVLAVAHDLSQTRGEAGDMSQLGLRTHEVLACFEATAARVDEMRHTLVEDIRRVDDLLHGDVVRTETLNAASSDLREAAELCVKLADVTGAGEEAVTPEGLHGLMRTWYTMDSERLVHTSVLGGPALEAPPSAPAEEDVWL